MPKSRGRLVSAVPTAKPARVIIADVKKINKNTCIFCQSGIYYIKINKKRELVVQAERKV